MNRIARNTSPTLILALAMALSASASAATEPPPALGGIPSAPPCPSLAEIETAIGFPVKSRPVPIDACMLRASPVSIRASSSP